MKRKILLVTLFSCMAMLSACGGAAEQAQNDTDTNIVEQAQKSVYDVTIDGVQKAKDHEDKDCVVASFTFTNNSDENINFSTAVSVERFQNGISLSPTFTKELLDNDTASTTIQPETTIDCQKAYLIEDNSDVKVEVYDYYNEAGDVLIAEKTFKIE